MIAETAAYILISTITMSNGGTHSITQSTATFADKPSCENAQQREDVVLKEFQRINTRWNLTCVPYSYEVGK